MVRATHLAGSGGCGCERGYAAGGCFCDSMGTRHGPRLPGQHRHDWAVRAHRPSFSDRACALADRAVQRPFAVDDGCGCRPATTCSLRSWPGYGTCPHPPDLHTLSPGSRPRPRPDSPVRRKAPQTANPAPAPGPSACPLPGILAHQDHLWGRDQLTALFAESGLRATVGHMAAAPTMTSSGLLFPATASRSAYLSRTDHRHIASGSRNKWATSCPPQCEYTIFCDAEEHHWSDSRPHLWGLLRGLPEIGTESERIAKFPARTNTSDPWHGYPVSALDKRREFDHRPQPQLVRRWVEAGLIDEIDEARINRGKV